MTKGSADLTVKVYLTAFDVNVDPERFGQLRAEGFQTALGQMRSNLLYVQSLLDADSKLSDNDKAALFASYIEGLHTAYCYAVACVKHNGPLEYAAIEAANISEDRNFLLGMLSGMFARINKPEYSKTAESLR